MRCLGVWRRIPANEGLLEEVFVPPAITEEEIVVVVTSM